MDGCARREYVLLIFINSALLPLPFPGPVPEAQNAPGIRIRCPCIPPGACVMIGQLLMTSSELTVSLLAPFPSLTEMAHLLMF